MAVQTLTHIYSQAAPNPPGKYTAIIECDGISTAVEIEVTGTPPATPANLAVPSTTPESVTATWDPVDGATSYSLGWRAQGGTEWTWIPGSTSPATVPNLTPATAYEVTVKAVNVSGESPEATPVPATTTALTAPTATAASPTASSVDLSWTAVDSAQSYTYKFKKTADADFGAPVAVPTGTTVTVPGLDASTAYDFQVAAVRGSYTGPWSATAAATTTA
jgi:predicted phage tail protein